MALQYGTATAITCTMASIASAANRSSVAVTTSTTANIVEIMLELSILTSASAPTGNKQIVVYGYKSTDGTNFDSLSSTKDDVDGTDKALTAIGSPTNLVFLGTIQLNQGAVAVTAKKSFLIAQSFGHVPPKWGFVVYNDSGVTWGATATAQYREIYYT